jgi:spherulation-specific family 4 protein
VFSNATYNAVIDTAKTYHRVPTMVVLNPGSGPGSVVDGNYTAAIRRLQGAGCKVLGYVHTTGATRALATVQADVDTWLSLYPMVDGIFIDEMTNDDDATHRAYFTALTGYIHHRGLFPSGGNPGTDVGRSYFTENTADIIVVYENAGAPSESSLKGDFDGGYMDTTFRRRAAIMYDSTQVNSGDPKFISSATFATTVKYVGWVYVTDDAAPNPWDAVTTAELAAIYTRLGATTA